MCVTEKMREQQCERQMKTVERGREKKESAMALLHFLIELLSGRVNLHSVSGCRLLRRQINIDSLLSAFSSSMIRRNGRQIPTLDQAAGQLVNFLKRRGKKALLPFFFFLFFWRVVDQAQKHFHYSRLLSAIHKTTLSTLGSHEIQEILNASASFPSSGWENDILMEMGQKYHLDG